MLPVTDALVRHQITSPLRGEVGATRRVRGSASRFEPRGLHEPFNLEINYDD